MKKNSRDIFLYLFVIVLAAVYVVLTTWHYTNQRPMWNDEWCIFRNLATFSVFDIFNRPLIHDQVFPRAYLYLIQISTFQMKESSLLQLRFWPYLSMMAGFFLWMRIARRELRELPMWLMFTGCWLASSKLLYYAAELKPYSMDLFAGAMYTIFLIRFKSMQTLHQNQYRLWLFCLPLFGLFSYPAFFFGCILGYNLLLEVLRNRRFIDMMIFAVPFISVMIFSYYFDMRLRPVQTVTAGFGDYFISTESIAEFVKTWSEGTKNMFARWFAEKPRWVKRCAVPFALIGFFRMVCSFAPQWRKDRFLMVSVPVIGFFLYLGLFLLGVVKKYPFGITRTALFFAPFVMFYIVDGIFWFRGKSNWLFFSLSGAFSLYIVFVGIHLAMIIFGGDLGAIPNLLP